MLGAALLVKILFPIEVESTIEISSFQIYPAIIAFLGKKLFTIGGFVVQVRWLLLAVWMTGTVCIAWSRIHFYRQLVRRSASAEHLRREISGDSGRGQAGERVSV